MMVALLATYIPLREWASKNNLSYRNALYWAKQKKIPAKKKSYTQRVFIMKELYGYVIMGDAKPPEKLRKSSK